MTLSRRCFATVADALGEAPAFARVDQVRATQVAFPFTGAVRLAAGDEAAPGDGAAAVDATASTPELTADSDGVAFVVTGAFRF